MEPKIPIIQGGMGVGISLGGLAGAVAKEGGIGLISAAQIGFREPDFGENPLRANKRAMRKEFQKAKEIAPDGIVGFNIMTAMKHYEEYVRTAADAGADLVVSGAGLPVDMPAYVQESSTKIAPIVSTDKSAKVILKYWDRKYKRTADLVVIEGPKAGGHLGFQKKELETYTDASYIEEMKAIKRTIEMYEKKYGVKIPVAAAGGIYSSAQVKQMLALGMDMVQIGTRFVTTEECDADIRYKEAYLNAKEENILIVKSPVGMPGRAIRNKMIERIAQGQRIPPKKCYQCLAKCSPAEIPYCITRALIEAAEGNTEDALLFCGAEAWRAEKIETVRDVIQDLLKELC